MTTDVRLPTVSTAPSVARHGPRRPRLGIVKLASCDGCQLTLLDLEDELVALAGRFDIVEFPEATSVRSSGPFDILLVEGSVAAPEQIEEIVRLRSQASVLITIGACATAGGIQALRNWLDHDAMRDAVYPHPEWIESLATATPIADHVTVDAELRGCPVDPRQLRELLLAALVGRRPQLPDEAVCLECKRRGLPCVVVSEGLPCLGPVTRTGCGALCPLMGRGCYGCFGPREGANVPSLASRFRWDAEQALAQSAADDGRNGRDGEAIAADVGRLFANFTAWAEPFRRTVTNTGALADAPDAPAVTSGAAAAERRAGGR
jgi:coenzyme F420-reducing hydrogenase gamma subunit